jgi:serine beta-lactamase-like protein LACTB
VKSFSYSKAILFIVAAAILCASIPGIVPHSVARSATFDPYPVSSEQYNQAIQQGRKNMLDLISRHNIPGFSIAIAVGGKIVWSEGFGFADLENRVEARPSTRYRIGSLSKLLTVSAVAQLYEQGRLDLDAPVQRYVPSFPKKDQGITTRQLAGHLAGIKQYARDEYINLQRYATVADGLKIFQDSALLHPPGSKYSYSSYGYNLLAAVIEGASGQSFLTYIREKVFGPLKMESTMPDENARIIPHRTRFYSADSNGQLVNAPYTDNSDRWGAGGFLSSVEDLVRFASAHLRDGFLKAETRALMFTSQKTTNGKETNVGLGWRIGKDSKGRRILHHGGDSIGGRAYLLMYPDKDVAVVMLANKTFAKFGEQEAAQAAESFMGE